ncbi:MAG: ribonuclease III [Clostridia bacterium]|nr:ribonuclease III [Clostridia bacterium]MBR5428845.1 ribonuclease III [Clostridia bacterium]
MEELEKKIGYIFKDKSLLRKALTHSSYANEAGNCESNERLEFLGDSVLGFVTADTLFHKMTDSPEGEMTKRRAAEVCEKALFGYAKSIGLGEYILLGRGEERSGGRNRPSLLADAFESLIAAIYLDGGIKPARKFIRRFIGRIDVEQDELRDYKTLIQEIIQKNPEEHIDYILVSESGPAHDRRFEVEVHLNSNVIGTGVGRSKKKAEQAAAREALLLMGYKED